MILYVANRGEIARRIIRTAKRMGIRSVVGYARQDKNLPFVQEADEAVSLEGEEALETYLNFEKVLSATKKMKATHLHPGYGFLSENARFVDFVTSTGLEFIGPTAESMRKLGDKIGAREFLRTLKIPLLPAYQGEDVSLSRLKEEARKIGYPLLIKPSAGGGGKGMVRIFEERELEEGISSSQRIARSAFHDSRIYLERFVSPARHIEVQILGDKKGNIVTLGERECSLQRKHQKIIEEAPCGFISENVRNAILENSKKIAEAVNYESAGTVEWIWDGTDGVYFLEVNTRLQVEHPVTEEVWGIDLVEWQLRIANGESLESLSLSPSGHAVEARLCAEDPSKDFLPTGGKIHYLRKPEGVRFDLGYEEKNIIPPHFDSLLGKIISKGATRKEALEKLEAALKTLRLLGPSTNRTYLLQLLKSPSVQKGDLSTDLVSRNPWHFDLSTGLKALATSRNVAAGGAEEDDLDWYSPWGALSRKEESIDFDDFESARYFHSALWEWTTPTPQKRDAARHSAVAEFDRDQLKSPMPAKVIKILVEAGQKVKKGDLVVVLEAMKMEHQLKAPRDTTVKEICVKEGDRVGMDVELVKWESHEA